jgi:gluconate 5-dehydrogenase
MTDLFNLTGRTALITGASRGIGLALAQGLGQAGATVILNGRAPAALTDAAQTLTHRGITARVLPFDVTDPDAARSAIDGWERSQGPIDILITNAGIQHRAPLQDFAPADFARVMQTNVMGVFHPAQACARHMIARGQGKIIAIASLMAALARPTVVPYTASKGAVATMIKGMAADWGPLGLQCNAIAPGYFATDMNRALTDDAVFTAWITRRTPAGRWGRVEELQGAAIFLASAASSFVNGQTIYVDGGISATL